MKKALVYLCFLHYYYEILDYKIVDDGSINSYEDENYHIQVHVLRR